jgi:hypothetical protein
LLVALKNFHTRKLLTWLRIKAIYQARSRFKKTDWCIKWGKTANTINLKWYLPLANLDLIKSE